MILRSEPRGFQYDTSACTPAPTRDEQLDAECSVYFGNSSKQWDSRDGRPSQECESEGCFWTYQVSVRVDEDLVDAGARVGLRYRSADLYGDAEWRVVPMERWTEVERRSQSVNYNAVLPLVPTSASRELQERAAIDVVAYADLADGATRILDGNATVVLLGDATGFQYNSVGAGVCAE